MTWQKLLIIIILFYLFALLQNSFLWPFNLFGATPNLGFIFFFLLVFFEKEGKNSNVIFFAVIAGFFTDIFSYSYIGASIILLVVIGILLKKIQLTLKNREDGHPFVYFLPLFFISLLVYDLFLGLYLNFLDPSRVAIAFGLETVFAIIYNLLVASASFFIYKWLNGKKI